MSKYVTYFSLLNSVSPYKLKDANQYLQEDNMTKYLIADMKACDIIQSEIDQVIDIEWRLDSESRGRIVLTTKEDLHEQTLLFISEWVLGQNADGLGEGFEQQNWGESRNPWDYTEDEEDDYTYQDMYSFDWRTNQYLFEKEK